MISSRWAVRTIAVIAAVGANIAGAAGTDYNSWDGWTTLSRTSSSPVTSSLATTVSLPTSGTATYKGAVAGVENRAGNLGIITGTTELKADFATRNLSGTFDNLRRPSGTPLGGSATQVNAAVDASWGATNRITGTLSANTSNNGKMLGNVNGAFFGLNPAGTWSLVGGNTKAGGIFAAKKQ